LASLNQIVCAQRFFCGVTLGCDKIPARIAYSREPRRLPSVLSADEVVRFVEIVSSSKARVALIRTTRLRRASQILAQNRIDRLRQAPFGGPEQVLAYLARCTHRGAIANSRFVAVNDDVVGFTYKDYRRNGRRKSCASSRTSSFVGFCCTSSRWLSRHPPSPRAPRAKLLAIISSIPR
jgi:hypothetical protein